MDDDSEKTIVNSSISKSKKERWENAVDPDGQYSSMSHLIRRSVENELSGDHEPDGSDGISADDIDVDIDMDELTSILDTRFDDLSDQLSRIQASVKSNKQPESSLTNQVLEIIPKLPDTDAAWTWIDSRMDNDGFLENEYPGSDEKGKAIASATRIANQLDVDESEVWDAIYTLDDASDRYFAPREDGELWLFELTR